MLSFQTVLPDTLELLRTLMQMPELEGTRLVGGTSLALQYGHRRSVDLDLFGKTAEDADELTDALKHRIKNLVASNYSKNIKTYFLNNVKVDIVNYHYSWIDDPIVEDGLRLASSKDIAAMKVNAIIGRGSKKDFIDIYYILQHCSFSDLMNYYLQKYPDGSAYRAMLSMAYFDDADPQPMPYMFEDVEWNHIKRTVKHEVEVFNQSLK